MTKVMGLNGLVSPDAAVYAHHLTFRSPGYPCRRIAKFESLAEVQKDGFLTSEDADHFADEIADTLGVTINAGGCAVGRTSTRLESGNDVGETADYSLVRVAFHAMYLLAAELCLQVQRGGRESIQGMSFDIEDLLHIHSAKLVKMDASDQVIAETYAGLIWLNRLLHQIDAFEREDGVKISFQGERVLDRAPGQQRADMLFALADSVAIGDFDAILLGGWEMFKDGDLAVPETDSGVDLADIVAGTRMFLEG